MKKIMILMIFSSMLGAMEQQHIQSAPAFDGEKLYDDLAGIGTDNELQKEVQQYLHVPPKISNKIASDVVQKSEFAFQPSFHRKLVIIDHGSDRYDTIGTTVVNNRMKVLGGQWRARFEHVWDEHDGQSEEITGNPFRIINTYRGTNNYWPTINASSASNKAPASLSLGGHLSQTITHRFQGSPEGPYAISDGAKIFLFDRDKNQTGVFDCHRNLFGDDINIEFCTHEGKDYVITMERRSVEIKMPVYSMGSGKMTMSTISRDIAVISLRDMQGNKLFTITPSGTDAFRHFMCYEDDYENIKLITSIINEKPRWHRWDQDLIKRWNLSDGFKIRLACRKNMDPYQLSFLRLLWPYMMVIREDYQGTRYHPKLVLNTKDHRLAIKTLRSFDRDIQEVLMGYIEIKEGWYEWAKNYVVDYWE